MGECVSKNSIVLTNKQIKFLQEKTGMTREEIDFFHREFIADHPDGYLTEDDFIKIYQKLYNYKHPEQIAKLAFRLFDQDKNGQVTFDEFLLVSAFARLNNKDHKSPTQENSTAQNYDPDDDAAMNRSEVEHALFALYDPFEGYDRHECRRVADQIMGANQHITHDAFIRHIMEDEIIKNKYIYNDNN